MTKAASHETIAAHHLTAAHDTLLQANELLCLIRDCVQQGDKCRTSIFSLAEIGIKITGVQAEAMEDIESSYQKLCEERGANHE